LLADRNLRLKKLGEETVELVVALADDDSDRASEEAADLIYHMMVALRAQNITFDQIRLALASRAR
jgi:phosphoribosyl-AMP cyclohydrolase / phosphoribosyl-ATP pyrophosphohydrolase